MRSQKYHEVLPEYFDSSFIRNKEIQKKNAAAIDAFLETLSLGGKNSPVTKIAAFVVEIRCAQVVISL